MRTTPLNVCIIPPFEVKYRELHLLENQLLTGAESEVLRRGLGRVGLGRVPGMFGPRQGRRVIRGC